MIRHHAIALSLAAAAATTHAAGGGPYSAATNDPDNPFDAPIPGFEMGRVNPLFSGWAVAWQNYHRADGQSPFSDPDLALGPVTGDPFEVVALGDLTEDAIAAGATPGSITLVFDPPIEDMQGADFAVFENALVSWDGGVFAELAFVEASADGVTFHRFPATSLTAAAVGPYGTIDPANVHNLAGKHANHGSESWGTPFDLADVGLSHASHIRIVDIPGNGAFTDAGGRPIYDAWLTFGSGGFDLDAVGAISQPMRFDEWPQLAGLPPHQRAPDADPDGDGVPNLLEFALARNPAVPDATPPTRLITAQDATRRFTFVRDCRVADLVLEIQSSENLANWTTIAVSTGGASFSALPGHMPEISETSAHPIRSIGVIRRVEVVLPSNSREFLRLRASLASP